ncbi:MAG: tyrosine-type recombinase/integrase [Drouetiella hepatica Uher 2000/2452]|jgi:integrase/recombinase XerD|uniref:Tyrosine-type recombinase/integrase n=1 Tax=Drouetiella hepatica Uher 2000/2452 TaxID=904376 RepID=A0A951QEG9_9CYAN|nr:tyrosine-type recombinase/integrase [Drouetiella hepatica Uher 2000/2452]
MPKSDRSGQAEVLSPDQLNHLWQNLEQPHRLITQICYYSGSRIGEVCQLRAEDIKNAQIVFRSPNTKTKQTKTVDMAPPLRSLLDQATLPKVGYLFPAAPTTRTKRKIYRIDRASDTAGRVDVRTNKPIQNHFTVVGEIDRQFLSTQAVDKALRKACKAIGLDGVSTHTFRRSLATHLYRGGVPLRTIMAITGHKSLASLTLYINLEQGEAKDALFEFFKAG